MKNNINITQGKALLVLRILLATAGAYASVSLVAAALALALGEPRLDAARLSLITAFLLQPVLVIWVFGCRNLWRAAGGVVLPALMAAIYLLLAWPAQV